MTETLEIILYLAPPIFILLVVYLMLHLFFKRDRSRQDNELRILNRKTIAPLQLQAYERIVLFLERITPANLITREFKSDMTAELFRRGLLTAIRQEYEHNMSQQLFVSSEGWEMVKNAKEVMIRIVNEAGTSIKPDASAADLSEQIFERYLRQKQAPIDKALEMVKEELRKNF